MTTHKKPSDPTNKDTDLGPTTSGTWVAILLVGGLVLIVLVDLWRSRG